MQKEKAPLGLYIHIPFCRQKCAYCDFYSLPRSEEKMDAYTAALLRHIEEVAPRTAAHRVDTVYFGGGTPSYLGPDRLTKLLRTLRKRCPVARDAEITLEANPDSACDVKALRALRRAGFNGYLWAFSRRMTACFAPSAASIPLPRCRRPWPPCGRPGSKTSVWT